MNFRQLKIASVVFVCLLSFIPKANAQDTYDEKHTEISLRMIGHQILLNSGDSTSRVLPITKNGDRYKIEFASEFTFTPEKLVETVNKVVEETELASRYIVEVEECETGEVVYGYEIDGLQQSDITPCLSREQAKSCYYLLFTLKEIKKSQAKTSQVNYITIAVFLALILVASFFLRKKQIPPTPDPNLIPIGAYHFDKNTTLLIENEKIELTSKEADLLLLLYNAANTTVEREVILNKVWGDEGDYVGRTLDVFISKLRKKLKANESVKIVNARGIGYKLVV